ncbi:peptide deformylase, partial [Trebonia sp.]|uniref:peptide deformylase n=1 Tax=Trebonia sp. TaxID=2767075 RepID=UPI003CC5BC6F
MAIRPVRLFGDPILRTVADPVTEFDKQLRNLVKDLTQTLDDAQGAGLAAPQIGVGLRVFAYVVGSERGYLVNPELSFP